MVDIIFPTGVPALTPSGTATLLADDGTQAGTLTAQQVRDLAPTAAATVTSTNITDASAAGRTLLTAASAAAQKTALSLDLVTNTSDASKPVSTAQAAAIALKLDKDLSVLAANTAPTFDDLVLFQNGSTQYKANILDQVLAGGRKWFAYKRFEFINMNATADEGGGTTVSGAGATPYGTNSGTDAMGIINLERGTTATGAAGVSFANLCHVGGGRVMVGARFKMPTLPNGTDRFTARLGAMDSVTAEPTNGIYFRYADNVNSGKVQGVCRAGGVETVIDTGVTPVANTWLFGFWLSNIAGTSIQFYLAGAAVGAAITTNIPTTIDHAVSASNIGSLGTNGRQLYVDFLEIGKEFAASRT